MRRLVNWLRTKLSIVKPGVDFEVIGEVLIVRVDCGNMPRNKALEYCKDYANVINDMKSAFGVKHSLFIPYFRS